MWSRTPKDHLPQPHGLGLRLGLARASFTAGWPIGSHNGTPVSRLRDFFSGGDPDEGRGGHTSYKGHGGSGFN